ncbi:hypothetical protein Aduo_020010 [Ancylostoma duodenale]
MDTLSIIYSNRTIRGDVTIAPRWIADVMGRLCNVKRIVLMCEPYGSVVHGCGTIVEVVPQSSILIKPHNCDDLVYCSLISTPSELKVNRLMTGKVLFSKLFQKSYGIGDNTRYTATLDLPNSTYKWRCLGFSRIARIDMVDEHKQLSNAKNDFIEVGLRTGLYIKTGKENVVFHREHVGQQPCAIEKFLADMSLIIETSPAQSIFEK